MSRSERRFETAVNGHRDVCHLHRPLRPVLMLMFFFTIGCSSDLDVSHVAEDFDVQLIMLLMILLNVYIACDVADA